MWMVKQKQDEENQEEEEEEEEKKSIERQAVEDLDSNPDADWDGNSIRNMEQ